MKKYSKYFFLLMIIISSLTQAMSQVFVQAETGTNAVITEKGKARPGLNIGAVIGYTITPQDATRINFGVVGQLRQFNVKDIDNKIIVAHDETIAVKAGFEVGQALRMGVNFGLQGAPWANNSESNYKRFGGFTEGTLSYNRSDGMSIGAAVKAERSLRANRLYDEGVLGKTLGIWSANLFMKKTFGKQKPKAMSIQPQPATPARDLLKKSETVDFILSDSTFGKAMTGFVNNMVMEAIDEHIQEKHSAFPVQPAQPLTLPNTIPEQIPVPYNVVAPKVLTRFETFFGIGKAVLSEADKAELDYRTRGLSIETSFRIYSYTSSDGGLAENKKLCRERANCVEQFLRSKGFKNFYSNYYSRAGTNTAYRRTVVEFLK